MALNPITFTERVVDDFLHYQLTTYPLADVNLYQQLRALLELEQTRDTPLRKGPFVSLSRPFKQGASVEQLIEEGVFHPQMRAVVPYPQLRAHQEAAIRAIHAGQTTLVSTGTGSGKTEAFLYPIISRCLQLQEEGAPPGIVAIILYPMNALAEDQLERLRGLLAGRGIPFGMYVGKTPETEADVYGVRMPVHSTNAAYHADLKALRAEGLTDSLIPSEERASREAMRAQGGQPRILLTNVKQLDLLLTRAYDVGLFAGAPLEFLVFDEAHTFRGAQGAETACLIRRLRTFCDRAPDEIHHIATSATMADPEGGDEAARGFARRFFGVSGERVTLVHEVYDELRWNSYRSTPAAPRVEPNTVLSALLEAVDAADEEVAEAISTQIVELGGARLPEHGWQAALASQLVSNELVYQLAEALARPRPLTDLAEQLSARLQRPVSEPEILAWLALGAATGRGGHDPLLRPVVHSFIRGVGGAVVTLSEPKHAARLWLSGEDADAELGDAFWRFPITTCTTCGQHYYEAWVKDFGLRAGVKAGPSGGDLVGDLRLWARLPEESGGDRVVLVDRLVVSPDEEDDVEDEGIIGAAPQPSGHDFEHKRLYPLFVCAHCGSLQATQAKACGACGEQRTLAPIQAVRSKDDDPGLLHACVACQAPGRRPGGGRYREPARPVRAVGVSDVHVLAQSMVHLSERPRLLVFADNRQDAAFQAGWMQDHARRFRLRALMTQQITPEGVSVGDVVYRLDDLMDQDRELSRALLPEVWQVVPLDDSSTKHREERLYFLRLQVLREIATGVKQRLGLEPWGRLKVTYTGLDASVPFIARWAPQLRTHPETLMEGVAALLDHLRRVRVLHDESTHVFERMWSSGDKEVQYGYLPAFSGGPRGLKLSRNASNFPSRAMHWLGERPTQAWNAVKAWGVPEEKLEGFLRALWEALVELKLLVPVKLKGWGKVLKGSAGVYQIDSAKLTLHTHSGFFRCEKCRRTTTRSGPKGLCMAWHCGGRLSWETEPPDDYNLRMLDGDYSMLRVAEHSGQVPTERRERIENQFKGEGEQLNTLVCTPTLELGVDIGALDAVLMRNVPPSAANYWQRAGRAGRRHRMAVDITYAQARGFDQAYFREPLKLLGGQVEPPRFNLKNEVMIRKHAHATVLMTLLGVARDAKDATRVEIEGVIGRCFPRVVGEYLFTDEGEVLERPRDVSELGGLIFKHRAALKASLTRTFTQAWPDEDAASVTPSLLGQILDELPAQLQEVIRRLKRRLDWALGELRRLNELKLKKGNLDPEDKAHEQRCEKVIGRLKRVRSKRKTHAANTLGVLVREGFLPGYGLEVGHIVGTAEPPRMTRGLEDFELHRAVTLALREYVPGNAIYANGFRFVPRRYLLSPEETLRFRVVAEQQVVQEVGVHTTEAPLAEQELRAVPMCDVILPSQSQISDEEEFRFQMPVATYGHEHGYHRGGTAWSWGSLDLRFRRGVRLRLVNVGPRQEVHQTRFGFPVCLACGQSHSPFASKASREQFEEHHLKFCNHAVQPTGFYADVEVDVLGLHDVRDRREGFSVAEALRMGAARVLDMEVEDLQLLALGHIGQETCDVLLYDPMPGGSGLLEQLTERWVEVRAATIEFLAGCPSACETSCIDCLQTYRNRFYHEHLDRHVAQTVFERTKGPLVEAYPIPEKLPNTQSTTGQSQTWIEWRFQHFLSEAGLPAPRCQVRVDLGPGYGWTIPDFFYEDEDGEGICIYLDGMSAQIHGDPKQAEKDKAIRAKLKSLDYTVIVVRSFELDDRGAIVKVIAKIARLLDGKRLAHALKNDTTWFDRVVSEGLDTVVSSESENDARFPVSLTRVTPEPADRYVTCVPLIPLKIAAGAFGDTQELDPDGLEWVRLDGSVKVGPDLFVAQVLGESMNRRIPNGAWCLWKLNPVGSRQGRVVLVQHREIEDPEHGGSYTVKVYHSRKSPALGGGWRHSRIELKPDSTEPSFEPLVFEDSGEGRLRVIAELVQVLN
ncbi:DEAD/DEAH box helicase [Myxococcota bacterium]|nr:DEAD/DEAH box helicase [Myxococcota bacterium]